MSLSNADFYPAYILDAVKAANGDPKLAVVNVVNALVANDQCFSSGEVVRILRIVDPSLNFSVKSVGVSMREAFFRGEMPPYDLEDGQTFPLQVSRTCQGLFPDRTPAGQMVFVYGSTDESCEEHEFEVFTPVPNQDLTQVDSRDKAPATPAQPVAPKGPLTTDKDAEVVVLQGKEVKATLTAKVTAESRLYIPRKAFEHHAFLRGKGMRGGDAVYISNSSEEVVISLAPIQDGTEFTLEATRGRVKVPNSTGAPFAPDDEYEIVITADDIRIVLE